jgi:hypothetical protein
LANRHVIRNPSMALPSCRARLAIANIGMMNNTSNHRSAGDDST